MTDTSCAVTFYDAAGGTLDLPGVADMSVRGAISFPIPAGAVRVELSLATADGVLMEGFQDPAPAG
jgi:hypothetical protein